ncbi:hypothetical protein CPC08DRAFT_724967 [Agrocybe pediades]|nr:hypothetical protein CPC08DRAFT_724967 [Agrocybe pediades]
MPEAFKLKGEPGVVQWSSVSDLSAGLGTDEFSAEESCPNHVTAKSLRSWTDSQINQTLLYDNGHYYKALILLAVHGKTMQLLFYVHRSEPLANSIRAKALGRSVGKRKCSKDEMDDCNADVVCDPALSNMDTHEDHRLPVYWVSRYVSKTRRI